MTNEERNLGEVWKDRSFRAKKPWFVKTPSGVARFQLKRQATAVGELYLRDQAERLEKERMVG